MIKLVLPHSLGVERENPLRSAYLLRIVLTAIMTTSSPIVSPKPRLANTTQKVNPPLRRIPNPKEEIQNHPNWQMIIPPTMA